MDLEELEREVQAAKEQIANTSIAPSVATRSVAGGMTPKRRARIEEEENEIELEQAKKRKIKERQKREADEEIDRRNAE